MTKVSSHDGRQTRDGGAARGPSLFAGNAMQAEHPPVATLTRMRVAAIALVVAAMWQLPAGAITPNDPAVLRAVESGKAYLLNQPPGPVAVGDIGLGQE